MTVLEVIIICVFGTALVVLTLGLLGYSIRFDLRARKATLAAHKRPTGRGGHAGHGKTA